MSTGSCTARRRRRADTLVRLLVLIQSRTTRHNQKQIKVKGGGQECPPYMWRTGGDARAYTSFVAKRVHRVEARGF